MLRRFLSSISFLFGELTLEPAQLCCVYSPSKCDFTNVFSWIQPHSDLKCHRTYYLFAFPPFGLFFSCQMCSIMACGSALMSWVTHHWEVLHLDWSQLSLPQEHQAPPMPIGELFWGGKCSPVPRGRFVLFLQSQRMWRYTYSIYWIPPIPTQRSTLPYLEYSGHAIWQVYLPLQTARSAFVISRSQFLQTW